MKWEQVSKEKNLSIDFLQEHEEHIYWLDTAKTILLTKEFIEAFSPNRLIWHQLAVNPSLTIDLLEEIKDEYFTNWKLISYYYPITKEIYDRFERYIDKKTLFENNDNKKVNVNKVEKRKTISTGETFVVFDYIVTEQEEDTIDSIDDYDFIDFDLWE